MLIFMFEKILVATDGSEHSEKAAIAGIELSRLTKGMVTAIYVEDREKKGIEATERIRDLASKAGVPFEAKIIKGNPAEEILKFAEDAKMDIIVIGSIGVTGLKKFMMGSVAEKVVLHSKVPVMTIH
jgi:nucleotide-binding universal stress UspA family protein